VSLIDVYLRKKQSSPKPRSDGVLYVSDITKACLLQSYFSVTHPRNFPIETLRIFEAGNVLEDYWDKILEGEFSITVLATQLPAYYFEKGLEIHGRVDVLAQHNNMKLVVHEVKSARSAHWMSGPRDAHLEQIQFYMGALEVDNGQVDYLDKEAFTQGENPIDLSFPVKRSPYVYYYLLQRARDLMKALNDGDPPVPNPHAWGGRVCDYCQYVDLCPEKQPNSVARDTKP